MREAFNKLTPEEKNFSQSLASTNHSGRKSIKCECHHCHQIVMTEIVEKKMPNDRYNTCQWIIGFLCLIPFLWALPCILCMHYHKNNYDYTHKCTNCHKLIGKARPYNRYYGGNEDNPIARPDIYGKKKFFIVYYD